MSVRTFAQMQADLTKAASAVKAAATVPQAPEKDPATAGNPAVPAAPATNKDSILPPNSSNAPAPAPTKTDPPITTTPGATAPAKTITSPEEDLANKVTKLAAKIREKAAGMKKDPAAIPQTPPAEAPKKVETPAAPATPAGSNLPPSKENKDTPPAKAPEPKKEDGAKEASSEELLAFNPAWLIKLAQTMLTTETGREACQAEIERQHGAQAAEDLIKVASFMEAQAQQLEMIEQSAEAQAAAVWEAATPVEREQVIKLARCMQRDLARFETDMEKLAYQQGMADSAMDQEAGTVGQETSEDPMEAALTAVAELVQKGVITEEEAQQLITELQADAGGGEGGGAPAGGAPSDETPEEKEASTALFAAVEAALKPAAPAAAAK